MEAQRARAAAQISTLSSLPLLFAAQALPRLIQGEFLPWVAGAIAFLASTAVVAVISDRRISPERLLR